VKAIYLLSGLGADKRVFKFLNLQGYDLHYIEWIEPKKKESISAYAKRLLLQINNPNPILLGVSFGGLVAIEIGKLIQTEKIILISSVKTKSEIPIYYRMIALIGIYKLMPAGLLKKLPFTNWFFGAESERDRNLLKTIIRDTDEKYLVWAIDAILNWNNQTLLPNITHIHGTNDRLLPNKKSDHLIKNGGHFMIVNKAQELRSLIKHD
jgi:pimeloyl-ACP methyl ester carboxylesterase